MTKCYRRQGPPGGTTLYVVPKSRVRQKAVYTPPPPKTSARRKTSAAWVGPTIVVSLLVGLAWIVVYYLAGSSVPGLSSIGAWNIVIGFGFIIGGVALSTQWR